MNVSECMEYSCQTKEHIWISSHQGDLFEFNHPKIATRVLRRSSEGVLKQPTPYNQHDLLKGDNEKKNIKNIREKRKVLLCVFNKYVIVL